MFYHKILSIEPLKCEDVWDISFEDDLGFLDNEPNFIAQNIVLHNCHPAGIVLSPFPLKHICPLHVTKSTFSDDNDEYDDEKKMVTQFTMSDVESLGLIKFDVLGLSTKTAIKHSIKLIKDRYGVNIDLSNLPLNDKKTLELLKSGKTDGCFQLENPGMKQTLVEIGVDSFDDLVAAIALYRPGPKDYIPLYARRKRGQERVVYPHPDYEKITKLTYSILIYQEQCLQLFMSLAKLTATEGYKFLKGCAKKKPEIIQQCRQLFINGCLKNGVSKDVAEKTYSDLEKFGGYAFNKAHSCSYAYESFKTVYLKAHYPCEFFAGRLSVELYRRKFDAVQKYEMDAKRNWGIKILKPDLNRSKMEYIVCDQNTLIQPIVCEGIGKIAAEDIVKNQPYKGSDKFLDFSIKVGKSVNTRVIESMHDLGMWPGTKKEDLLKQFELIKKRKRDKNQPIGDMFE